MSCSHKWYENWVDNDTSMNGQAGNLHGQPRETRVNLTCMLQSFPGVNNKFFSVSMEGSSVAASTSGQMMRNSSEHRGWFTYKVVARISLDWENPTIQTAPIGSTFFVKKDAPPTTSCNGSVSSNSEFSVGASAGMMGKSPMESANVGYSAGTSFSKQISGFKITNTSSDTVMSHTYHLSECGSHQFNDANSLNKSTIFQHNLLSIDNDQAISNLPIISQCTWATRNGDYSDSMLFLVTVEHWMMNVYAASRPVALDMQQACWSTSKQFSVDFSEVRNPL